MKALIGKGGQMHHLSNLKQSVIMPVRPEIRVTGLIPKQTTMFKSALAPMLLSFNTEAPDDGYKVLPFPLSLSLFLCLCLLSVFPPVQTYLLPFLSFIPFTPLPDHRFFFPSLPLLNSTRLFSKKEMIYVKIS